MKIYSKILLLAALFLTVLGVGALRHTKGAIGVNATKAEARIGRPLSYFSVAGVARRTYRRCAYGVYNCY